jgi:DNA mismatch repair protein MSH4
MTNKHTLAAFAALTKYVEHLRGATFAAGSVVLSVRAPFGRVALDAETQRHLELLENAVTGSSKSGCLLSVLNRTHTAVGERFLKDQLRSPVAHKATLELRFDCVDDLLDREASARAVGEALKELPDMDAMLSHFATRPKIATPKTSRSAVTAMMTLRSLLAALPGLARTLAGTRNPLFLSIVACLEDAALPALCAEVSRVVGDGGGGGARPAAAAAAAAGLADPREPEVHAVRPGVDADLDAARRIYADTLLEIADQRALVAARWGAPALRAAHAGPRGFVFVLARADVERAARDGGGLPAGALQPVWARASVAVTTDALASLNARLGDALLAVLEHAARALGGAGDAVRGALGALFRVSDAVAMLDALQALAATARAGGGGGARWVRPALSDAGATALLRARHPVLEASALAGAPPVVANSVSLGGAAARLLVVTGANAAGKSTALRMIGCVTVRRRSWTCPGGGGGVQ